MGAKILEVTLAITPLSYSIQPTVKSGALFSKIIFLSLTKQQMRLKFAFQKIRQP